MAQEKENVVRLRDLTFCPLMWKLQDLLSPGMTSDGWDCGCSVGSVPYVTVKGRVVR